MRNGLRVMITNEPAWGNLWSGSSRTLPHLRGPHLRASAARDGLHAGEPDELPALRARVRHAEIAVERDEASKALGPARSTDGCGAGFRGRDAERPAGRRTRNRG